MIRQRDIIVIGAGLAGAAATMQAARAGFNVLALAKPNDPGYWARVGKLRNFPGLTEESGADFLKRTREHAESLGAAFHDFDVISVKQTETRTFTAIGGNSEFYEAPVVIIATGVSKDEHFLAGERELVGRGAYYSVQNDAPSFRHQTTVIIGKTEEAAKAAIYLSRFSEKIYFVIPSSKLDIPQEIFREVEANRKIEMLFSSSVKKLSGTDELHSATILSAGTEREIKTRAAFIYTYNLKPRSDLAREALEVDKESGRIPVNSEFSTSLPGIFACGDILSGTLQNPAVSTAQGIITALNAEKFLRV